MNTIVKNALNQEYRIGKNIKIRLIDILFFAIITIFALLGRLALFEYAARDYNIFLSPWFDELKAAGGIGGIGLSLGDYTPPYIYIMSLLTYLPIDSLTSIKIVSVIFDFICAIVIMVTVYRHEMSISKSLLSYGVFLFIPTVILNSAMWSQCDVIFTTFLLLCIYSFIKNKPFSAVIFFSIAFIFKIQAVFLAPLLLLLWIKGKMKFRHFFIIPAVYIVSVLPAMFAGRSLWELLTIYISQSGQYKDLSLNAPNFYTWITEQENTMISMLAIMLCGAVILGILYVCFKSKFELDAKAIISFAMLFSLIVPFLLPHMHERYFYLADAIAVLYAFYLPKRAIIPILIVTASMTGYCPYLFATQPIKIEHAAFLILAAILIVIHDIRPSLKLDPIRHDKIQN